MNKYNVGVIGVGDISDKYINNLKQYDIVNVLACAARSKEKAEKRAAELGIPRAYGSAAELINDVDIDIVLNLTVPGAHSGINNAALKAGKHVYSEKPLGTDLESARETMRLAEEKGLYIGCAPDTFLGARLQTCREIIDQGKIGDIIGAGAYCLYHGIDTFHNSPFFYFKEGAGPLLDMGPYYLTALFSLMGPVKRCSAMAKKSFNRREVLGGPYKGEILDVEVDTHILGNLEFASGAIASVITSFDVWDSEMPRIEIYGTKGTICMKDPDPLDGPNIFGGEVLLKTQKEYRWFGFPRDEKPEPWIKVPVNKPFSSTSHAKNSRGIGLVDMAYAIRDKRSPRASGKMAFHALEVMIKMLESAKTHEFYEMESSFELPVPLPEDFTA